MVFTSYLIVSLQWSSAYGEAEGGEQGGERGERDVNHDAPFVLGFLFHGV